MAAATKDKAPALIRPFVVGSREQDKNTYSETYTLSATQTKGIEFKLNTIGYSKAVYVLVTVVADNTGANTVAFNPDGIFAAVSSLELDDSAGKAVHGPFTGREWLECIKHGGYTACDDPRALPTYTAGTTGTGATAGSGQFCLRIPIELFRRNSLGSQLNKSATSPMRLNFTLADLATIYSTAPKVGATVTVSITDFGWMDAASSDGHGNAVKNQPPSLGTIQFWERHNYDFSPGTNKSIVLTSIDGLARNIIFELRDNSATPRTGGDAAWPSPLAIEYEAVRPVDRIKAIWQQRIAEEYGYGLNGTTIDGPLGLSRGVYPWTFMWDGLSKYVGNEQGFTYLPVTTDTNLTVRGSWGGSNPLSLIVYVNKLWPATGNPLAITGGR